jgi:hypothetical protein
MQKTPLILISLFLMTAIARNNGWIPNISVLLYIPIFIAYARYKGNSWQQIGLFSSVFLVGGLIALFGTRMIATGESLQEVISGFGGLLKF